MVEISETELIRRWVALSHEEREVYIERAMAILRERDERGELTGSITADGMKEAALLGGCPRINVCSLLIVSSR